MRKAIMCIYINNCYFVAPEVRCCVLVKINEYHDSLRRNLTASNAAATSFVVLRSFADVFIHWHEICYVLSDSSDALHILTNLTEIMYSPAGTYSCAEI
jgi:hypothetical protein